jgi:post-segregation antitoxin (ccd killing protein)
MQLTNKGNVALYLDKDLVEKSKELGFNLSKTFENHLKQLMIQFSTDNSINNMELTENKETLRIFFLVLYSLSES